MSIFPSDYTQGNNGTTSVTTTTTSTPILLKEYAIDFDTGKIMLDENNKFIIVEGMEAVKVRCWLALKIQRGRYLMYMSVGNKIKSLIGNGLAYANKNIQTILDDALVDGEYVTSIEDISLTQDGDKVTIDFTINSIYGSYSDTTSY